MSVFTWWMVQCWNPTPTGYSHRLEGTRRLPWWLSGSESACRCRRRGFDPWVRKIPWWRKRQPTPAFLPGKSHRQRKPGELQSMESPDSDVTSQLNSSKEDNNIRGIKGTRRWKGGEPWAQGWTQMCGCRLPEYLTGDKDKYNLTSWWANSFWFSWVLSL